MVWPTKGNLGLEVRHGSFRNGRGEGEGEREKGGGGGKESKTENRRPLLTPECIA